MKALGKERDVGYWDEKRKWLPWWEGVRTRWGRTGFVEVRTTLTCHSLTLTPSNKTKSLLDITISLMNILIVMHYI